MAGNNLNPVRTVEEARERGRAGGLKSGEARREKRSLREHLEAILNQKVEGRTRAELMTIALIEKALAGDCKAYELVRDTIGENPKQVFDMITHTEPEPVEIMVRWQQAKNGQPAWTREEWIRLMIDEGREKWSHFILTCERPEEEYITVSDPSKIAKG